MAALVYIWRCLPGLATAYLVEFCGPHKVHGAPSPSIQPIKVSVYYLHAHPPCRNVTAVVGPSVWNGLPLSIRSLPRNLSQTFLSQLKAVLFGRVGVGSASE